MMALTRLSREGRGCRGRGQGPEVGAGTIGEAEKEAPAQAVTRAGQAHPAKILMLTRRRKGRSKKRKRRKKIKRKRRTKRRRIPERRKRKTKNQVQTVKRKRKMKVGVIGELSC